MDSASNALLKMKNSIGAAVAPALQALIPILQTIVSWVITAANALNQFLSLLTGKSTWTRAKDVSAGAAKSLGGAGKAAKEAAEEIKGLLADWDELNIIQQESSKNPTSGSGGGGAGGVDYADMFEEVSRFDKKIRDIVEWIQAHAQELLEIAKLIGAAILAWKVSSAFGGIIGTLAGLAAGGLIIAIVWKMTTLFDNEYLKTGKVGWLVADVITAAVGANLAKKVISSVLGTGAGTIAASLTLVVSAAATIKALIDATDVSALSTKGITTAIVAGLKGGAAGFVLAKGLGFGLLKSGVIGIAATGLVFGAAIGIKAIVQAVDSGVTIETIKAGAIAALSAGLGAGLVATCIVSDGKKQSKLVMTKE